MEVVVNGEQIQLTDVTEPNVELESINTDLRQIEKDLTNLRDIIEELRSSLGDQSDRIQTILSATSTTNTTLTTILPILKSVQPLLDQYHSLRKWGLVGSCVAAGGALVGAVAANSIGGPLVLGTAGTITILGVITLLR